MIFFLSPTRRHIRARRSKINQKIDLLTSVFLITCFLNFFEGILELFRKFLNMVFGFKRPTFGADFNYKSSKIISIITIFVENLTHFRNLWGSFLIIFGSKKTFSAFFQSYLGVVFLRIFLSVMFSLKRPSFGLDFFLYVKGPRWGPWGPWGPNPIAQNFML